MDFVPLQLLLAGVGAFVAMAQHRALRRVPATSTLPAWNAKSPQIAAFAGISILCLVLVPLLCSLIARFLFPETDFETNILYLIPPIQALSVTTLLCAIFFFPEAFPGNFDARRENRASNWLSLKNRFGVPAFFTLSLFLVLTASLFTAALVYFSPEYIQAYFQENQRLVDAFMDLDNLLVAVLCVPAITIFTPVLEELIFRASLYRFFKSKMSAVSAAVLSSVIFALIHDAPATYLPLTFFGCVLCFAYEKTGRIAAPILIHALFNATTLFAIALNR